MSSFAAIPILGYSILAFIFSYIVQRLIRIVNFRNLLARSSSAAASSSSSSLETLPTSNPAPSEAKHAWKSRISVPSWDLTPFKRTTANAYRKASALVLPSRDSVELLPTHVASPPPTAALVDYGVYTEKPTTGPVTPLPSASTPPLTSSPTPSSSTSTTSPRTPSPAHHSSPFSIPLRVPLPTPFSLFPSPYVPLQPQPPQNGAKGIIISPNRPRTPSPPFLATTPPPTTAHRRSKSLGGVPVKKVANSRLGLGYAFPHDALAVFPHAEVEMRDLYRKDAPLIDFSSSEDEGDDNEDVGVFGRKKKSGSGEDSLVPGGPLEMVAMPLVDLSDTNTRAEEERRGEEEDVFGFKKGVVMSGRRSLGGDVKLPLTQNFAPPETLAGLKRLQTLIDIDVSTETEEKLVDVDVDVDASACSSKTISPMEPVVLSTVPPSRVASPGPVPVVEPLVHLPVVEPLVHLPVAAVRPPVVFAPSPLPVSVSGLDEAVVGPAAEEVEDSEGGEELVHVVYEDAVVVPEGKGNVAEAEEEEEEEEEEGVLVDVSPRPVDVEVSLPEVVDGDVEASLPEVVEASQPEVVEVSQLEVVEVYRPMDVEVSAPEVLEVSFPKTTDVLVDVPFSLDVDEPKPADLPQDQDTTSSQKPTAWQWDEEDDMMRAWSLGLDLVEAPLPLDVVVDVQVVDAGSPHPNESESLLDEKPLHDLLIQQPPTDSVEDSPPLPLLPPLTIPLITISNIKREQALEEEEEEYPDPELLPLPEFTSTKEEEKEKEKSRSPPSQTPTPPDSPPLSSSSSPGGLVVKSTRTAPSSPRLLPASPLALTRPAWSLRAADAPPLGLSSSSSSTSVTPVASPSLMKKGGVVLLKEEVVEEVVEEADKNKIKLSEALPGSFPDSSQASSASNTTTTTTTTTTAAIKTLSSLMITPDTRRIRVSRSPLDIALAMQLRPGLGVGADPAWMVRFLMAMFGWFAILVSGQGEF